MGRLPIRVRLTLAFALALMLLVATGGAYLYVSLRSSLDDAINQGLRSRSADVAALVSQADSGLRDVGDSHLVEPGDSFAQVTDLHGRVLDATPRFGAHALLSGAQLVIAAQRTILVDRPAGRGQESAARLLATPVIAQDRRVVVIVGTSLQDRSDALANLRQNLRIGGPLALLLVSLLAYGLATLALRPVESMRRRATKISAGTAGQRLPLPASHDEVRRLGETLNEMLGRLEGAYARERSFVADASHELRTPLSLIKAELEIALSRPRTHGELTVAIGSALEETDRLVALAQDLLVLARSDSDLPLRRAAVDVGGLLSDLQLRFATRVEAAARQLRIDTPDPIVVQADRARLEQALDNLVENALQHGHGAIRVSAHPADTRVEIHVCDEGPGFPDGFERQAFERFTRADPARGRGGAGLGLAIVSAIAQAHGGGVGARTREPGGADVWLWLPPADVTTRAHKREWAPPAVAMARTPDAAP